jgi:outer membrane lipoprotein SlyB
MKGTASIILIASLMILSGCAHTARNDVIIDPAGVDMAQYERDLSDCQKVASQVRRRAAGGVVIGAIVGGAMTSGGYEGSTEYGARVGGIIGGVKGARATRYEMKRVLKNCISNRGYTVLN